LETNRHLARLRHQSGHEGELTVLALFAAAIAAASPSPVLESSVPWWERITVIVDDKGEQQNCKYEISLSPSATKPCDPELAASIKGGASGARGAFSKVTFERRFSPGGRLDSGQLQPGDELLGRQVMYLTFDGKGAIESCKVVAATGELTFQYNCEAARKEQFRAQDNLTTAPRQAFMTVLAYGHSEQIA
jgi:hypothetical protein